MPRLVHHLVYTSLSASAPAACEATFEAAQELAKKYTNGYAVLFISGAREIWEGEEGIGRSYHKNFACPICSRERSKIMARSFEAVYSATQLPPGEYRATIARD